MKATEGRAADVWHLVSVQRPAKVPFLSVLPRGPSLGYRLKLTLLPLTFPDDDAPEGGQLNNRIVGEKRRISCGSRWSQKLGTHSSVATTSDHLVRHGSIRLEHPIYGFHLAEY